MGLVRALGVVEAEVVTETDPGFSAILICFQIYLLIFHCPPQPLDEQVVVIAPFSIHADSDSVLLQEPCEAFTGLLKQHGIRISMDGKGSYNDNLFIERLWRTVKYEEVYLKAYQDGREARVGIGNYFRFYNTERPHQALGLSLIHI